MSLFFHNRICVLEEDLCTCFGHGRHRFYRDLVALLFDNNGSTGVSTSNSRCGNG